MRIFSHRFISPATPLKKPLIRAAKDRPRESDACLKLAYLRIHKNRRYHISAIIDLELVARRYPEKWICTLTVRHDAIGKQCAFIEIHWNGNKVPTLEQIEGIKNDFLGEAAYFETVFHSDIKHHSVILRHRIGEDILPRIPPTWRL